MVECVEGRRGEWIFRPLKRAGPVLIDSYPRLTPGATVLPPANAVWLLRDLKFALICLRRQFFLKGSKLGGDLVCAGVDARTTAGLETGVTKWRARSAGVEAGTTAGLETGVTVRRPTPAWRG